MIEDKLKSYLKKIGLSTLEQDCYLALVKKSPQKASDLAKKFGEHKSTVLDALHNLTDKYGVIKRSKQKNTLLFLIEDIKALVNYLDRQEDELSKTKEGLSGLIPELRGMQNYDVAKPKIYYFEGIEGIHKALEQVLEEADEYYGYGSVEDDKKYLPDVYPDYYERRVAKKILVKSILPALPLSIKEAIEDEVKRQRKTHLIPKEFYYPIQVNIYRGTVVFFSYEEGFALMIKSKPIADCLKMIFEFAYQGASSSDKDIRTEYCNKTSTKT
jgi:sugar-specific transcriptional regulator TrmB